MPVSVKYNQFENRVDAYASELCRVHENLQDDFRHAIRDCFSFKCFFVPKMRFLENSLDTIHRVSEVVRKGTVHDWDLVSRNHVPRIINDRDRYIALELYARIVLNLEIFLDRKDLHHKLDGLKFYADRALKDIKTKGLLTSVLRPDTTQIEIFQKENKISDEDLAREIAEISEIEHLTANKRLQLVQLVSSGKYKPKENDEMHRELRVSFWFADEYTKAFCRCCNRGPKPEKMDLFSFTKTPKGKQVDNKRGSRPIALPAAMGNLAIDRNGVYDLISNRKS